MDRRPTGTGGSEQEPPQRHETPYERADRRWSEMLQEVRVAQTGAQILFGFLLSVAFTNRFAELGTFDKTLYVITVVLGALATGTLIAPVSYHRLLSGHRLKPQLVESGGKLISAGVTLLALTVGSSLLLLLHVATGSGTAWAITAAVMAWFTVCWLVLPWLLVRSRSRRR